ncbi:MAG: RdgB/HAM1 family non-canonical purine NTP pyrophosphatase [Clostridia bacterium]|nr:RdgB/HAM1 family non-canonical purine NTP pyrophosphatase [Clostridia bacterium]
MKTIVLASNNKHKISEFKEMLPDFKVLALKDVGFFEDIVEDGTTFLENSLIKARAITKFLNEKGKKALVIADDSGLCVNSLNGEPGVYSARYAGEHGNNVENRAKLLKKLKNKADRSAYFVCLLTVMNPDGTYSYVEGKTFGHITPEERGNTSFCYDCLFYSDELKKTFGEATDDEKNSVSHRGRAIKMLIEKGLLN